MTKFERECLALVMQAVAMLLNSTGAAGYDLKDTLRKCSHDLTNKETS